MKVATIYRYICEELTVVDPDCAKTYIARKVVMNRKQALGLYEVDVDGIRTAVLDVDVSAPILEQVLDQFIS